MKSAKWPERIATGTLLVLLLALATAPSGRAAESLDPSFGEGGISFPGLREGDVWGLAQDAQGRLIGGGGAPLNDFLVSRYLSDGALDRSFGNGRGNVQTALGPGSHVNALVVQRDGKILAAGATDSGVFVLARYDEDGRRDRSYGVKGQARTIAGPLGGGAQDVEIQPSGRILAAGYAIDNHHRWSALLTAYRPDGTPARRFGGSDGVVELRTKGEVPIELVSLEALPSGKIRAAGTLYGRVMVIGLLPDGRADPSFGGGDGLVLTDADMKRRCACSYATDLEIDRRGRLVVSANATVPDDREPAVLLRFLPSGKLDRGFGHEGMARTALGSRLAGKDLATQRDGRLVLAGTYNVPRTGEARVAVLRHLPNGRLDRSFARGGFFTRDFGYESVAYAALTQRDGRVVVAGRANSGPSPFSEDPSIFDTAEVFLIRFLAR